MIFTPGGRNGQLAPHLMQILRQGPPSQNACDRVLNVIAYVNFPLPTNGDNAAWSYLEFPPEVQALLMWLGPWISSITAHTQTLQRSTNHSWKAGWYKGFDGTIWGATVVDLFSAISANGSVVQTPVSTASDFSQAMRWVLASKNGAGAAVETALISLALVIELKT